MDGWFFGSQACYDPAHQNYLVVGGQGPIYGVFTTTAGIPAGAKFQIGSSNDSKPFGVFPRCTFSADVNGGQGGFLVSWHQDDSVNFVHTALVAYPGGVIPNSERVVSDGSQGGSNFRFGVPISYSPTSKRFLVAFGTLAWNLQGRFIGVDGSPVGGIFALANAPSGGGVQEPALTWNSAANEFGLSYSGFDNTGGFVGFKRVSAVDGAQASTPRFGAAVGTFGTGVGYNPTNGHYVMGWSVSPGAFGAEIDGQGNVLRTGLISSRLGTPTSFDLAFNPVSGTFLTVSEDPQSSDVVGLQLNNSGTPNTVAAQLTNGCANGSFFPRVGARTDAKEWNITFARCFTSVADQIISTTSSEAGPSSDVQIGLNSPTNGAVLNPGDTLTISGWAVDRGATSGTGIDFVDVWLNPGSNGIFVGRVTSFTARQDVSNLLGAQFVNTGFTISKSGMAAGSYVVAVYPHSTVLGAFDFQHAAAVNVSVGGSLPLMSLDSPADGASIVGPVTARGWALDKLASSGTGVDAVHVWAFPASGAAPIPLGAATLGLSRPDVGAVFGPQFNASGFSITGSLPTGTYNLVAYTHDTYSGQFRIYQAKTITVQQSDIVVIDAPGNGATVPLGSVLSGWAVSLGAGAGSGIDFVHVYASRVSDGLAFFVGAADAVQRDDVAGIFGAQYGWAGFRLPLTDSRLKGQQYDLIIYAHSVTGAMNARVVRVTIQ
jgi:hypothetical protein